MELVSAICPACGKTIEVDPSEEVDFCKECGKPLAVKDAIKLYTEKIERDEAGCKPDEKVMEKFNAILAQDYDLAKRYLDDFIRKEYPKLDVSFFPKYDRNIYNIYSSVDKIETDFENLQAINPWIGEMYYSLLHPFVNACCKAVYDVNFTGELSFLKLRLMPIERKLDELISYIDAARRAKYEHRSDDEKKYQEKAISCWKSVWNDCIDRYKDLIGQEHDDEYIEYITDWLYRWGRQEKELSANYKMKYDD